MTFGLMLASFHYPRQKTEIESAKNEKRLQITSPISKSQTAPFPPHRLSDISIAIHSNFTLP